MRRLLVPATLALVCGCVAYPTGVAGLGVPAAFAEGEAAYLAGDYSRAKSLFIRFKDSRHSDPFTPWAHYWIAKCDLNLGSPRAARILFSRALSSQLSPHLEAAALMGLGDAYYAERDHAQAYAHYRRLKSGRLVGRVRAEELELKLGMCQKELGRRRAADRHFSNVIKTDASSRYAREAAKMRSATPSRTPSRAAVPARGRWHVQAGVFSKSQGARDLQSRLRRSRFSFSVVTERKAGAVYYVVRGGTHATEAAAKSEAGRLQAAGFQCVVKK